MSSGTENGCGCLSLVDCAYACLTHVGLQDQRAQGDKNKVTFPMAEVLVSRSLFYEILEKIKRLKPIPIGCG
jgi:hypothetical protein